MLDTYIDLILASTTFALALGTFWMARSTHRLAKVAHQDFRAARLPAIDLEWEEDSPGTGVISAVTNQGVERHGLSVAFRISTLSPNVPTFLEHVEVATGTIPRNPRKLTFTTLNKSQPLRYLQEAGWSEQSSVVPLEVPIASKESPAQPVRLIRVTALVSTPSAGAPAERWTSLSVVWDGIDFHVDRRLPFLREDDDSYRQRWQQALQQIADERDGPRRDASAVASS